MNVKEIVLEPFEYLVKNPGKSFRTQLLAAFQHWINVPLECIDKISLIVDMLHTASLLIDDIEDDSDLRRGLPVAHRIFGVANTINSANYVYFLAMQKALELSVHVVVDFNKQLLDLHCQGMDLNWRETVTCPTEQEYIQMQIIIETGGLLRLAVHLLLNVSDKSDLEEYDKLVNILGVLFQIRDDYMNLQSEKYADLKGFAEDLTEGKFSFPIIYTIQSNPKIKSQLLAILRQKTKDEHVKRYAIQLMQQSGAFAYTEQKLQELKMQALQEIERKGGNSMLTEIVEKLSV